jgi:2-polyprenyl-3-methyl-5-hydroxy-6-metoxy-1,4-benzoquinol methylase
VHKEFYAEYFKIEDKHWWFVGRRQVLLGVLDRFVKPGKGKRILDVGCGTGTMLGYLARYGEAQGMDADEEAIRFCNERGVTNVQLVPAGEMPFEDNTFDVVTMLDVLEHIDDDRGTLGDLYRVLKPGGSLLISVPAYKFLWGAQDEISNHKRRYVAAQLKARMEEAGFRVRKLSYFNTLLFPPIALVRVLRPYQPGSASLKSDFTMTKPGLFNRVLGKLFALEAPVVERVNLPFGVSIVALGEKVGK